MLGIVLLAGAMAGCSYLNPSANAAASAPANTEILSHGKVISSDALPAPEIIATAQGPRAKTGSASVSSSSSGNSAFPTPLGGGNYAGSLEVDETGAQMTAWNQTSSYCSETAGFIGNGTVSTDSSGAVTLSISGEPGSCVALISPDAYSSAVIEADIYFPGLPGQPGAIANWPGFWMTDGAAWPADGELDGAEVEPIDGQNAVTWHSGSRSALFTASTSGYAPVALPGNSANLTPGWHTVDIVYTKGFFAVYYDGQEYSSYTSDNVTGSPLNVYLTTADTPDISSVQGLIGGPPVNSDPAPSTLAVKYLRVWAYQ